MRRLEDHTLAVTNLSKSAAALPCREPEGRPARPEGVKNPRPVSPECGDTDGATGAAERGRGASLAPGGSETRPHTSCYGASISSILPSRVRWRSITLP